MPFLELKTSIPDTSVGIWRIEETEPYFRSKLNLYENEQRSLGKITHPNKRLEWLSSRLCLKSLLNIRHRVESLNNPEGRPYLSDNSNNISYSHSTHYAAAVASPNHNVAIDIEMFQKKRNPELSRMFMNDQELAHFKRTKDLHLFFLVWSAKETLFKLNGKRGIYLRENLHVDISNFRLCQNGILSGTIETAEYKRKYDIHYEIFPDFVLTYTADRVPKQQRIAVASR
jgi:phosphopantetheinyl transferase